MLKCTFAPTKAQKLICPVDILGQVFYSRQDRQQVTLLLHCLFRQVNEDTKASLANAEHYSVVAVLPN